MGLCELDVTCLTTAIGPAGLGEADLHAIAPACATAVDRTAKAGQGFFALPDRREVARRALDWARALPSEIENFVVLGIGGSSLAGRAIVQALARPYDLLRPRRPGSPRRVIFADNLDPQSFGALLDLTPVDKTVWNAISKSGGTVETAAQTLIVAERIERAAGAEHLARHLVVTTDPTAGALRAFAVARGLATFDIPTDVIGSFSVLSAVGLLPAAASGLDVHGLLDGAAAMRARVASEHDLFKNPALMLAATLYLHHTRRHRPVHAIFTYADGLADLAEWFRQLWGEGLHRPTPVAVRGAPDQHSQLELFLEGPDDKVVVFVTVAERGTDLRVPAVAGAGDLAYLADHPIGEILDAERRITQLSLTAAGRPHATLTLERLDAPSVGALVVLLQAATAFAGSLYGSDPFVQRGVERGKDLAYAHLGRPGYEKLSADAAARPPRDPLYVL